MVNKVKGYRVMAGYTQEDIAEKLGISRLSVIRKETGIGNYNEEEQKQLLKLLKEKIPDLNREDVFPIE